MEVRSFQAGDNWFPGSITSCNADGTYDIVYDNGDEEQAVDTEFIRRDGSAFETVSIEAGQGVVETAVANTKASIDESSKVVNEASSSTYGNRYLAILLC